MMRLLGLLARGAGGFNATYLRRVARCAVVSELRRRRPEREQPLVGGDDAVPDGRTPDPARALVSRELGVHITEALGRLAPDRRRAVSLYLTGHGVTETAGVLGWGSKRTENLVHRGLRDLRGDLERMGLAP